jgi:hypothetical protein
MLPGSLGMNQYFRTTERKGLRGHWSFASLKLLAFTRLVLLVQNLETLYCTYLY